MDVFSLSGGTCLFFNDRNGFDRWKGGVDTSVA